MAQKSCSVKRKHSIRVVRPVLCPPGPVQGSGFSVRIRLFGRRQSARRLCVVLSVSMGETNVQPILVFCIERPAARPLSRSPISRHDRARRRQRADAGLDRGHGRLAKGRRGAGPDGRRLGACRRFRRAARSWAAAAIPPAPAAMAADCAFARGRDLGLSRPKPPDDDRHAAGDPGAVGRDHALSLHRGARSRARPAEPGFHRTSRRHLVGVRAARALQLWRRDRLRLDFSSF